MENNQNVNFIKKFRLSKLGFYALTSFTDYNIGFSVQKKLVGGDDNYVSLIQFFIPNKIFNDGQIRRKPLSIRATFGKKVEGGIKMRSFEEIKFTDPVDAEYPNEYFYDIKTGKFYKKNKKIITDKLVNEIYGKHIKSTKPVMGILLRLKLRFWWSFMKSFWGLISKFFYFALFVISGDRYTYDYIFKEETLNGNVITSKYRGVNKDNVKESLKEGEKFDFFGYKASRRSIIFYSILHFFLFGAFLYIDYKPAALIAIFENNFLTAIYVILSFWAIEVLIPDFFKLSIKSSSMLSEKCMYKKINL